MCSHPKGYKSEVLASDLQNPGAGKGQPLNEGQGDNRCQSQNPLVFPPMSPAPFVPSPGFLMASSPTCSPVFILMPVFFLFPSFPVSLHMFIGNSLVSRWQSAITGWELQYGPGHSGWSNMRPWTVIGRRTEPMPFMGAIPVAMIEQNIHPNIRGYIYIGSGYHRH